MKSVPKIGTVGEERFVVESRHLIDFDDGMPPLLSTPWLVWYLEHAARRAVLPNLEQGESTVGVVVNVEHLAPTPVGAEVHCEARIIYVDGRLISFQFDASDQHERIARGTHKLRVVDVDRLVRRVANK